MIKNYHLVKKAELEYLSLQNSTLKQRLNLLDEMIVFSKKFKKLSIPPEETPHVKAIIELAGKFNKLRQYAGKNSS